MNTRYENNIWDDGEDKDFSLSLQTVPEQPLRYLYQQTRLMMGMMVNYKELRMIYGCAMKAVKTKFEILNAEFNLQYHRNPISSIQARLKSTASIVTKLSKLNKPIAIDNIEENVHDIAGIRVICSYIDDVFMVADALLRQDDIVLVTRKDYITEPKPNGYRSLHLVVKVPVFLANRRLEMEVEVQLRTMAMDFWASLEHQLRYKNNFASKDELVLELKRCAETINSTDNDMMKLRKKMEEMSDAPTTDDILLEKFSKLDTPIV